MTGGGAGGNSPFAFWAVGKLSENFLLLENFRPKVQHLKFSPYVSENLRDKVDILNTLSEICNRLSKDCKFSAPPTF